MRASVSHRLTNIGISNARKYSKRGKFTQEQAMKKQRRRRNIVLLFL
jgi:hypothetical protein